MNTVRFSLVQYANETRFHTIESLLLCHCHWRLEMKNIKIAKKESLTAVLPFIIICINYFDDKKDQTIISIIYVSDDIFARWWEFFNYRTQIGSLKKRNLESTCISCGNSNLELFAN